MKVVSNRSVLFQQIAMRLKMKAKFLQQKNRTELRQQVLEVQSQRQTPTAAKSMRNYFTESMNVKRHATLKSKPNAGGAADNLVVNTTVKMSTNSRSQAHPSDDS